MILLDTHIFVWWQCNPDFLSAPYRIVLDSDKEEFAISTISCLEIVALTKRNRIELPDPYPIWIKNVMRESNVRMLDVTVEVVEQIYNFPASFHGDPADRVIAATSIVHQARLATMDQKLRSYSFLQLL